MKRIIVFGTVSFLAISLVLLNPSSAGKIGSDCTYKGKNLYGKVKIVNSFPDFKVKVVKSFPDLKVETVTSFPSSCGKWEIVESFPDFTVQFVDSFEDFSIEYVTSFPGVK